MVSDRPSLDVNHQGLGSTCFPGSSKELFHTALQWGNLLIIPARESLPRDVPFLGIGLSALESEGEGQSCLEPLADDLTATRL